MTAHTQDDSPLAWEALARSGTTLVVYMGVARLAEIQAGLLAGGMAEDTPLAMIENATLGNQRECRSNLGELLRDAGRFALKKPGDPGDRRSNPRHRVATDFPERLTSGLFPGKEKPGLSRVFLRGSADYLASASTSASTRRLIARPSAVALSATGRDSP